MRSWMFTIGERLGGRMRTKVEPTRGATDRPDCSDSGPPRTTTPESIMSPCSCAAPISARRSGSPPDRRLRDEQHGASGAGHGLWLIAAALVERVYDIANR